MDDIENWNRSLFLTINGQDGTQPWLVAVAVVVGQFFIYLIPVLLLWMWVGGERSRRELALRAFAVAMLALGLNQIIPLFWQHPRPLAIGLGHTWIAHASDSSFPSDHATVFSALGITLIMDGASLLAVSAIVGGLLVAWARVFLGVHFPMDMIGAIGVAGISFFALSPIWRIAGARLTDSLVVLYRRALSIPIAAGWIKA